jgi:S-adenosylmethionine-diacylglycerol 3-amino-3-carboxypropyl transferase
LAIAEARSCNTLKEQREVYSKYRGRVDAVATFLNFTKRIWCPLIAVPASQLHLFSGNIVQLAADNLFTKTHLKSDNYHYFGYLYGEYTRECCPRYLKQENWSKLKACVGNVEIRTGKLHEVASLYPDGYFSRYILLDHMDWLARKDILEEWTLFVRKARSDVRFLWRSFADVQHIGPLKYLRFHPDNVKAALAMYPDRVFMYNSTHLATLDTSFTIVPRSDYKVS